MKNKINEIERSAFGKMFKMVSDTMCVFDVLDVGEEGGQYNELYVVGQWYEGRFVYAVVNFEDKEIYIKRGFMVKERYKTDGYKTPSALYSSNLYNAMKEVDKTNGYDM